MNRLRREGWAERPGKGAHVIFSKPGSPNEDGAPVPDLSGFEQPAFVVVIPFTHTEAAGAAA